jgi:hypothetical protein
VTKFLLIGLMAATALVPASAMAQDRGDRQHREAREGNRAGPQRERAQPQRNYQNERPQQARPQMPQRDFQNARPQQARPQQPQSPQRNYQGERPQRQGDLAQRRDRPQGMERPRGDGQQRWQGGDRRPDGRPDRSDARPGGRPDFRGDDRRPDRPGVQPGRPGGNWDGRDRRPGDRFDRNDQRPNRGYDRTNGWRGDRNDGWRNPGRDRQDWNDRRGWSRGWRDDNRYDWNRYRQTNRNVYRLPRYYPPSGYHYGYQRFSVGLTVGSMLYGSSYWINDPYSYRLPPAYGPYRWVRYYNDALLVDLESGEVVDTVYDLFW